LVEASGAAQVIQCAQITARGEGAGITRGNDHPADGGIRLPFGELPRELAHRGQRYPVERGRPIERDETRRAAPLGQEVVRAHALDHRNISVAANPSALRPACSLPQVWTRPRVVALAASGGVAAMRLLTGRITSSVYGQLLKTSAAPTSARQSRVSQKANRP